MLQPDDMYNMIYPELRKMGVDMSIAHVYAEGLSTVLARKDNGKGEVLKELTALAEACIRAGELIK